MHSLEHRSSNEKKYTSRNPIQKFPISRFLNTVSDLLESCRPETVVDLGCGEGFAAEYLAKKVKWKTYLGVDGSFQAVSRLNERALFLPGIQADLRALPLRNGTADVVMALEVFEHIPDLDPVWKELQRLAPRFAILSVPHEPWFRLANFARGKNIRRIGLDLDHVHAFSARQFIRLASNYGKVVDVATPFPWTVIKMTPA